MVHSRLQFRVMQIVIVLHFLVYGMRFLPILLVRQEKAKICNQIHIKRIIIQFIKQPLMRSMISFDI